MFIAGSECATLRSMPVDLLPLRVRKYFFGINSCDIYEIRLRCGLPLTVVTDNGKWLVSRNNRLTSESRQAVIITRRDIDEAVDILTDSSLYSFREEIKNGFITAPGGHRVGVCGTVTGDGEFITDISGLNYRYAREIIGCADKVSEAVFNNGDVKSTLIVSKPGCGKTTFLRDLIRNVSDRGVNISVVDERGEIAAVSDGVSGFDLGKNTDVLNLCTKKKGMQLVLRSMSPRVIAVDEFSMKDDWGVICDAAVSGVSVFATAHCGDWKRDISKKVLSSFKCIVVLSDRRGPGTIEECVYV